MKVCLDMAKKIQDWIQTKKNKYQLQKDIQRLLIDYGGVNRFGSLVVCSRVPLSSAVPVKRSEQEQKARYLNLAFCHNKWVCPFCATYAARNFEQEVSAVVNWAYSNHYAVSMITLTVPHGAGDRIDVIVDRFNDALRRLKMSYFWHSLRQRFGIIGEIKSTECTHGKNGFHWHVHSLYIHDSGVTFSDELAAIREAWRSAIIKAGFRNSKGKALAAFNKRAVHVMDNAPTSAYLAKHGEGFWGVEKEMACGVTVKAPEDGNKTLWELVNGSPEEQRAFVNFVAAVKGRQRTHFSRGLKARAGIVEKTDEQIAEEQERMEQEEIIAALDLQQWNFVVKNELRADLLAAAGVSGYDGIRNLLQRGGFDYLARTVAEIQTFAQHEIQQQQEEQQQQIRIFLGSG